MALVFCLFPFVCRLIGQVAWLDVDVTTAFEEEALLIGVELWVALCRLDLNASPQDTISADGVQERCVEGAEDVVLDADARRSLAVEGMSLGT